MRYGPTDHEQPTPERRAHLRGENFSLPDLLTRLIGSLLILSLFSACTVSDPQKEPGEVVDPTAPSDSRYIPLARETERVVGEYLVTLSGTEPEEILRIFSPYKPRIMKKAGLESYLIKLEVDPGPEEVKKTASSAPEIKAIQPNYIYRSGPLPGKEPLPLSPNR